MQRKLSVRNFPTKNLECRDSDNTTADNYECQETKGKEDFMGADGSSFGWFQLEKKKFEEEERKRAQCAAQGM